MSEIEATMKAKVGDHIMIPGRKLGDPLRRGEIVDVRGTADAPMYIVRWSDGHEGVCFPDSDVVVDQAHTDTHSHLQSDSHSPSRAMHLMSTSARP
jgi:hypothetical protein